MEKADDMNEDNAQSQASFPGSEVSSGDVSLGSSNIMNVSSMRDSVNGSDDMDIKKKDATLRPRGMRFKDLLGKEDMTPMSGKSNHRADPDLHSLDESLPMAFSPSTDVFSALIKKKDRQTPTIDEFYKIEREKLNIWTYLFSNLNRATRLLLTMCELEGRKEFCKGVIDVIDSARADFDKLSNKILVEESQGALCVWDISQHSTNHDNTIFEEYKNYVTDVTEDEEVEFRLLNEMVSSGKMSFYDAVVLVIRERAMMVESYQQQSVVDSIDSVENRGSDRSRSSSPAVNKVSLSTLAKRLNIRSRYRDAGQEQVAPSETKGRGFEERQKRAEEAREEKKNRLREERIKKEEKAELAKRRREEEEKEKMEEINHKIETGLRRHTEFIDERKRKAREVNIKAKDILFLSSLEKDVAKLSIDRRLLDTHNRRLEILDKVRQKQRKEDKLVQSVQTRKEEIDNEKKSLLKTKIDKCEGASKRRTEILEQKAKKSRLRIKNIARRNSKQDPALKKKNYMDFLNSLMSQGRYKLEDEELEVRSIQHSPGKQEYRRSKSMDADSLDITDFQYSYIFYRPKERQIPKKSKHKSTYLSLEQIFTKKLTQIPTKKINSTQISSPAGKEKYQVTTSGTKKVILNSASKEILTKSEKKKSQAAEKVALTISQLAVVDSPKKKAPRKSSIHSIEIDEKPALLDNRKSLASKESTSPQISQGLTVSGLQEGLANIATDDKLLDAVHRRLKASNGSIDDVNNMMIMDRDMVRLCTLCDIVLIDEVSNDQHLLSKNHKKLKNQYCLTVNDEKACILNCLPTELAASRLVALKKKCKRIRQTLNSLSAKNENIPLGKESVTSPNKNRLHKYSVELEKLINNQLRDFKSIETILKEVQKILAMNNENDLQILRANKFLSNLVEICKSVNVSHKNELGNIVKQLDTVAQLLYTLCSVKENRTYMLITNRVIPLIDLLLWSWNNASKYIYCLNYIPQLFHLIGYLLKHKLGDFKEKFKEPVLEYIIYCGLLIKLKQRFTSFSSGLDLTSYAGKVPLALLKAISLLETVTSHLEAPNIPYFAQSKNLNESICFLLKETEVAGCLQLMSGLLLSGGSFKKLAKKYVLPQTIFSVVMLIIKIFTNVARLDMQLIQEVLGNQFNLDQFYHCMMYILDYCITNYENNDEIPELMNETILLIGYFTYLNNENQALMIKGFGNNSILSRLTALPYNYFVGNTMEKDVLFPTMICAVYKNDTNLKVLLKEMSLDMLIEYLQSNIQLVNKHINFSDSSQYDANQILPSQQDMGSISASSATSSANSIRLKPSATYHYLLTQRISFDHWQPAIDYLLASELMTGK